MAKLWQFSQGHPKPAFSEKLQMGDQWKFLKNRPKSSVRLKGPKALCRKWHYPRTSMLLRYKDRRRFYRRRGLQTCPNGEVMAIFAKSPNTCIFWKSTKGGRGEIFQGSPKNSPHLKGPTALWPKWHYPLISMQLKCKDWRKLWRKKKLQKRPKGQVMLIFERSPKTRVF